MLTMNVKTLKININYKDFFYCQIFQLYYEHRYHLSSIMLYKMAKLKNML